MIKIKVLGNYAPNLKGLPGSSYLINGLSKIILLDLGNGNFKKLVKEINEDQISNLIVILSHNHVDHSYDVLKLASYLKKCKKKIKIYLPKKSLMYEIIVNFKRVFDVNIINEKTKIYIDDCVIDFCQTFHRGESYATRITKCDKTFVYTSDMSYMSIGLKYFCKGANVVLIDSGIPLENKFHLKGYHGITKDILEELFSDECNVKCVLASHLKASIKDEDYIRVFPKKGNVNLVIFP